MLCTPTARPLVLQTAVRAPPYHAETATAEHPAMDVPPSVKLTVPVGLLPVTVAVNLTVAPNAAGLSELVNVVVDATGVGGSGKNGIAATFV